MRVEITDPEADDAAVVALDADAAQPGGEFRIALVLKKPDVRSIPFQAPTVVHLIGLVVPQRYAISPLTNALVREAERLAQGGNAKAPGRQKLSIAARRRIIDILGRTALPEFTI